MISRTINKNRRGRRFLTAAAVATLVAGTLLSASSVLAVHDDGDFELDRNATSSGAAPGEDWDVVFNNTDTADASSFVASALFLRRVHAVEAPVQPELGGLRDRLLAGHSAGRKTEQFDGRMLDEQQRDDDPQQRQQLRLIAGQPVELHSADSFEGSIPQPIETAPSAPS